MDESEVPVEVLAELGEAACLCSIPGRADHEGLLDAFIRMAHEEAEWESRRVTRVESLGLFLSFHDQRPSEEEAGLGAYRRALLTGRFSDRTSWSPLSIERWSSWRAYQLRETEVLALGSLWTVLLLELDRIGPTTQQTIVNHMVEGVQWASAGLAPAMTLADALDSVIDVFPDGESLLDVVEQLSDVRSLEPGASIPLALAALLRVRTLVDESAPGFDELLDEGGAWRWSLHHLTQWFDHRVAYRLDVALHDLLVGLLNQHRRVGLGKVRAFDTRDPFCIAEDNGLLMMIRSDEPFWTAARYSVLNHLLWTLGLLGTLDDDPRPTDLGRTILEEIAGRDA